MFVGQGDLKNWTSLKRLDRDKHCLFYAFASVTKKTKSFMALSLGHVLHVFVILVVERQRQLPLRRCRRRHRRNVSFHL